LNFFCQGQTSKAKAKVPRPRPRPQNLALRPRTNIIALISRRAAGRGLSWLEDADRTHLERAGDFESEEKRHEQRPGHEPGNPVTESPYEELTTPGVDLRRVTQDQDSADEGYQHRNGDWDRLHLPVGDHVLPDRSLAAAGECVVDANTDRNKKEHSEQDVVGHVKICPNWRRHRQLSTVLQARRFKFIG